MHIYVCVHVNFGGCSVAFSEVSVEEGVRQSLVAQELQVLQSNRSNIRISEFRTCPWNLRHH